PTDGAKLAVKYAFARRNTANSDKLVISYSVDCGKTWSSATTRSGASLATTTTLETGSFIPDASEWRQLNLALPFLNNSPTVRFRFEFTSDGGNHLYVEDVQLTTVTYVSNLQDESLSLTIAPNPSSGLPRLLIDNIADGQAKIEIVDVVGKSTILSIPLQ
ncbi:hypothetical protein, partial [Stenotrophomonas maltophilia]|uniref:hypothetical protein n=1 Tax=Stenotrophomonas maltophilia TaxID=40324 RepID=UPI003BF775CF